MLAKFFIVTSYSYDSDVLRVMICKFHFVLLFVGHFLTCIIIPIVWFLNGLHRDRLILWAARLAMHPTCLKLAAPDRDSLK